MVLRVYVKAMLIKLVLLDIVFIVVCQRFAQELTLYGDTKFQPIRLN